MTLCSQIAAPFDQFEFLESLASKLIEEYEIEVFYVEKLHDFIHDKYKDCPEKIYKEESHEFISQVEQEVCMRSITFMPADGSSWSSEITADRAARDIAEFDVENHIFFT